MACLLHCCYLLTQPGQDSWRKLFWALEVSDDYLVVQYVYAPNPRCVDCDGSIVGRSIILSLAAPYEHLAEHTLTGPEYVKLELAPKSAALLFSSITVETRSLGPSFVLSDLSAGRQG